MTGFVGEWVRGIAGAALICAAATALTPKGKVKNVLKLICGIVLVIAMINPILGKDFTMLSMDISKYRAKADEIISDADEKQDYLSRTIIEDELETYILDKAKSMDADIVSVEVAVKWGDEGCFYPYEVYLTGNLTQMKQQLLSNSIEAELGVPDERQYWSSYEG